MAHVWKELIEAMTERSAVTRAAATGQPTIREDMDVRKRTVETRPLPLINTSALGSALVGSVQALRAVASTTLTNRLPIALHEGQYRGSPGQSPRIVPFSGNAGTRRMRASFELSSL